MLKSLQYATLGCALELRIDHTFTAVLLASYATTIHFEGCTVRLRLKPPILSNEVILSIAVHGMSCTAHPEGLIPMLLVFGSVPKIPLGNIEHLAPNHRTRFGATEASRKEMECIISEQKLKHTFKLRTKGV